jgi:hypothetical protein
MKPSVQRILLAVLSFFGLMTGVWAYFFPRHWYDTFPGMGLSWLPQLGPFNEHFATDTGAMFLGLATLSIAAFIGSTNTTLVRVAGAAWTVFNLLHWIFHMRMLHMYEPRDQVLNAITLSAILVVSALLLLPPPRATQANEKTVSQAGTGS